MAQRKTLTQRQVDILRWIGDGCPAEVMEAADGGHRITAAALRNRQFVQTAGTGSSWTAEITKAGRDYLALVDGPNPPIPRQAESATESLMQALQRSGGTITVPAKTWPATPGQPDWERRVKLAESQGRVPAGKRLVVTPHGGDLRIELQDAPAGTPLEALPVPVPARVTRYHPAVAALRDNAERHEVSRPQQPRSLRILQALATEAEHRGYTVAVPPDEAVLEPGHPVWRGDRDGHLTITVNGVAIAFEMSEEGMTTAAIYRNARYSYGDPDRYELRRDRRQREAKATGRLRLSIAKPSSQSSRPRSWADHNRHTLEDRLPAALMEAEVLAAEVTEATRLEREAEEAKLRDWQAALELARQRYLDDRRSQHFSAQIEAWLRCNDIRRFCDEAEARHRSDLGTIEWLKWARFSADAIDPLATPPQPPPEPASVSASDLQPFLPGWSAYSPDRR